MQMYSVDRPNISCYISPTPGIFAIYLVTWQYIHLSTTSVELANFWCWISHLAIYCWHIRVSLNMPTICRGFSCAVLRARDLARYCALVVVGHRFGKVSVLATTTSQIHHEKLEWTSNAARLKLEGQLVQINISFTGGAIVASVRS